MKTAFIGHRKIFTINIREKLAKAIKNEINNGCKSFIMGTHGEFDCLALSVCRGLRNIYKDLTIEVAITSLNAINKKSMFDLLPYGDVNTVMFDIEEVHYKQQITLSNKQMIDNCNTLICYVDTTIKRSGAKNALLYAEKRGLRIINLYSEEEQPFYGMTKEEINNLWKNISKKS